MLRILCAFVLVFVLIGAGCSDDDDVVSDAGQDAALFEAGVDAGAEASPGDSSADLVVTDSSSDTVTASIGSSASIVSSNPRTLHRNPGGSSNAAAARSTITGLMSAPWTRRPHE